MWFGFVFLLSVFAGFVASVIGFGIGSLVTPVLAIWLGTETAILVTVLPHLAGGLLRGWSLRRSIDRSILVRFGIFSAVGALTGALLFARLSSTVLTSLLGGLLVLTAIAGLTDWSRKWRLSAPLAWTAGITSGIFGGLVGNQGGLRAAALTVLELDPKAFVATSTAIGIVIDAARLPVYLVGGWRDLHGFWATIIVTGAGVIAGTLAGHRFLVGMPSKRFRILVSTAIGLLGLWFILRSRF
jgi:uncharacterized protein